MGTEFELVATVAAIGVVFAVLERLFPARPRRAIRWHRYVTDLLHMTIGGVLIRLGTMALVTLLMVLSASADVSATTASELPWWLQFVAILLVSDLIIWLVHRLFHAVPWLWEFHKIHHSSEDVDWLAAFRFHPVDQILTSSAVMLPWVALGFSPSAIAAYTFGYGLHSLLLHSNLRVSLGPLGHVVNGPRMHHWHHADHVEAYDRNFGAQLLIWDRLFGTLYSPPQPLPERYGVDDPPKEGFLAHLWAPFARRAEARHEVTPAFQD